MAIYHIPTKIFSGADALDALTALAIRRGFVICDPFLEQNGSLEYITLLLESMGVEYRVFSQVIPDPTVEVVTAAARDMAMFRPDSLIAFGGGSAIDTAKAATLAYVQLYEGDCPQLIAVPTTSGTGTEVTSYAVVTDTMQQVKHPLDDARMQPAVAILDSSFVLSAPPTVTADAAMDALSHALEAYVAKDATPFSDALAEKAAQIIFRCLPVAVRNGAERTARENLHVAAAMAGMAFNNAGLGLCHGMAHAIGGRFHLSHGRCNAILLPHVIRYNAGDETTMAKYHILSQVLGISGYTRKMTVKQLAKSVAALARESGIPSSLSDMCIMADEYFPYTVEMAEAVWKDPCTQSNPRQPIHRDLQMLLEHVYTCS